jgi:hypothetical protein
MRATAAQAAAGGRRHTSYHRARARVIARALRFCPTSSLYDSRTRVETLVVAIVCMSFIQSNPDAVC